MRGSFSTKYLYNSLSLLQFRFISRMRKSSICKLIRSKLKGRWLHRDSLGMKYPYSLLSRFLWPKCLVPVHFFALYLLLFVTVILSHLIIRNLLVKFKVKEAENEEVTNDVSSVMTILLFYLKILTCHTLYILLLVIQFQVWRRCRSRLQTPLFALISFESIPWLWL